MMSRTRRMPNKHRGFCTVDGCGEWVEVGEGFIPLPYDPTEPTPLHCPSCWELFAALDAAMALHEEIPDHPNGRKPS